MSLSGAVLDWTVFACAVILTWLVDALVFGRGKAEISFREATVRSLYWMGIALAFGGYMYLRMGMVHALDYITAYLVEESLSVDNLFVFLVVFRHFRAGPAQQRRVLRWGVGGAVVMRGIFVGVGTVLLTRFQWTAYLFGAFLVVTGARLAMHKNEAVDPEASLSVRLPKRYLRTTSYYDGTKFFTRVDGVRKATALLVVLVVVELTDLVFAVDSVPAVLAISNHVFIVYSSNVFAILGLRALYFMLAGMMDRFHYLNIGLSVILIFVGAKMAGSGLVHISSLVSLGVVAAILAISMVASLLRPPAAERISGDV